MTSSPRSDGERRRKAERRGRRAEGLALLLLRLKGYRLLVRGYRRPQGEVDLILRRRGLVIFVEVKSRAALDAAAHAILARQKRRISNAASLFLAERPEFAGLDTRFDAVLLSPGRWPRHVEDAWRESDRGIM